LCFDKDTIDLVTVVEIDTEKGQIINKCAEQFSDYRCKREE